MHSVNKTHSGAGKGNDKLLSENVTLKSLYKMSVVLSQYVFVI